MENWGFLAVPKNEHERDYYHGVFYQNKQIQVGNSKFNPESAEFLKIY